MNKILFLVLLLSSVLLGANKCVSCHGGIEHIREESSGMMKAILEVAQKAGHKGNDCIVCHGGNPATKKKSRAHFGTVKYFKANKGPKEFYPSPASALINKNTCGMCHQEQVNAQMNSLMMSEQEKIQSALWSFGAKNGYNHDIGNHNTKNPDDPHKRLGTESYKKYMDKLSLMEPQVFPKEMKELAPAPTAKEIEKDPSLAVYRYLQQKKLDLNSRGCASCHIPYSKGAYYKGNDKSINKKERGHILVHSIQSSRDTKVTVKNREYSGIPVKTCSVCHSDGKSTASSYTGFMKTSQSSSNDKRYSHMREDVHFKKGMLCQDCHTSNDMHGDGFLAGASLAAVEVECQDCHGTTKDYPWELPLGYSDEFNTTAASGEARGTAENVAEYLKKGSVSDVNDGYLLTARGNPFPHATRVGDEIKIELANGKDVTLTPLKKLKKTKKLSQKGLVAMDGIVAHNDKLECYTCHSSWAPQFYGTHLKIDYSNLKSSSVNAKITEYKEFVRFENIALSQNGEGRVSPTVPASQATITVIAKDGRALLDNHVYKIPNVEGGGEAGQKAASMSSVQPHTVSKEARECESCHSSSKALGLGINGLKSRYDYSKFIDENGTQLQTVGHHFKLSNPLSKEQRDKLDRRGVCLSCHIDIPKGSIAMSTMDHIANMADMKIDNKMHKTIVNKTVNITAWVEVLLGAFVLMITVYGIYVTFIKKKPINPRNEGWK